MAFDVAKETVLTLPEAAIRLGRSDPTVRNWIRDGVDGVRLESARRGAWQIITSVEACDRFQAYLEGRRVERARASKARKVSGVSKGARS